MIVGRIDAAVEADVPQVTRDMHHCPQPSRRFLQDALQTARHATFAAAPPIEF